MSVSYAADSDYVNGEATGTTKAQQDSDEEVVDTGHCTSPRQRGNGPATGSDRTGEPAKASPSVKQEDKGSANPTKVQICLTVWSLRCRLYHGALGAEGEGS